MPISNIIKSISAANPAKNAAKVPSWHGYVYKTTTGLEEDEIASGKYKLVLVKANGDQYVYEWDGVADFTYLGYVQNSEGELGSGDPVPGTTLAFDPDFLEAVAANNWESGSQETYDTRRTAGSNW